MAISIMATEGQSASYKGKNPGVRPGELLISRYTSGRAVDQNIKDKYKKGNKQ
jgi:hypothetical protein